MILALVRFRLSQTKDRGDCASYERRYSKIARIERGGHVAKIIHRYLAANAAMVLGLVLNGAITWKKSRSLNLDATRALHGACGTR